MTSTRQRTALVTGASGFIGARLCWTLREQGWTVVGLRRSDRGTGGSSDRQPDRWLTCDLAANDALELPTGIDTIFHLAGKAHALSEVAQDDAEYARINTEGTRRVLAAAQCAGVRAFVFFSSIKAAGDAPAARQPIDETWAAMPDTPYGRSKRAAEQLVLGGGFAPHSVVLRPCLVYGANVKGNLARMIEAVRRGRFPSPPEFGNKRSMVHVDDVVAAALLVADRPEAAGRTYIIADGAPFSTRELYAWMCAAVGRLPARWTTPYWMWRMLARVGDGLGRLRGKRTAFDSEALAKLSESAWYSAARIERELGWKAERTVRESLRAIANGRVEDRSHAPVGAAP